MNRRRGRAGLTGIAVCVIVTLTGATPFGPAGAAAAAPAPDVDPRVTSLAADEGIPLARAAERIGWQDASVPLVPGIARRLGQRYGGAWFDPGTGDLVIGATAGGAGIAARTLPGVAGSAIESHVRVVTVRWSDAELARVTAVLSADIARINKGAAAGITLGTVPSANVVDIEVGSGTLTAAQVAFVATARQRFGNRVRVVNLPTSNLTRTDACTVTNCDPPLRGGVRIDNPGGAYCTLGFIVRSNYDDRLYALTAGHCLSANGPTDNWWAFFADGERHLIGGEWNAKNGGSSDSGIISINNPDGWEPRARVLVRPGPGTTLDESYGIAGTGGSVVDMRICKTGAFHGSSCGKVTKLNVTDSYGYSGLGRASYYCGEGDSGGPVFANHIAYGIHRSGNGETTTGYVCHYVGITKATADLGVRVAVGN